ncbi:PhoH family protein [Enterococcus faecium]|nr:PhoH family protein [Enterococcus faecium]
MSKTTYPKEYASLCHHFNEKYGYNLMADPYQLEYVLSMNAPTTEVQAVFVDAPAGTGKTSLAVKMALYQLNAQRIDEIFYYRAPLSMHEQGFLSGDLTEKERPYMTPCVDTINSVQKGLADNLVKAGKLHLKTTTFERGADRPGKKFVIVDEAQNYSLNELRAVLTRFSDDAKIVIIGSTLQNDAPHKTNFGRFRIQPFSAFIQHFVYEQESIPVRECPLVNNYRGRFSQWADEIDRTIKKMETAQEKRKLETTKGIDNVAVTG